MFKKFLAVIVVFAVSTMASAEVITPNTLDSLYTVLSQQRTPKDSIPVLYNIHDCTPRKYRPEILEQLYATSLRAKDYSSALEMLFHMSARYSGDSLQNIVWERVNSIPASDEQKAMARYIKYRRLSRQIRQMSDIDRQHRVLELVSSYKDTQQMDFDDRIEYLFYLILYLRYDTEGGMFIKYMKELQTLVEQLPDYEYPLKTLFYAQAQSSYMNNGMYAEAARAAMSMLQIADMLDKIHGERGRIFRDYDGSRSNCYITLLRCHSALPAGAAERYYKLQSNLRLNKESPGLREMSRMYYCMATQRYAEAMPLLEKYINNPINTEERNQLIAYKIEATHALGDKDGELEAMREYFDILRGRIETRADESYKELQILYEVNNLKQENNDLLIHSKAVAAERHQNFVMYSAIVLAVFFILLIITLLFYRKSNRFAREVKVSNSQLIDERNALKTTQEDLIRARDAERAANNIKDDFVNNLSQEIRNPLAAIKEYSTLIAECADADKRKYMKKFVDVITLNSDLLLTLVNDVLNLPSIEKAKMSANIEPASMNEICRLALDNVRNRLQPGVKLVYENEGEEDVSIRTDFHRVEQILHNLLSNAAKFTSSGTITLGYRIHDDGKKATFIVTDTGIGIPDDKEEVIFSRFGKIHSDTQGNGLGLYISRLLADMLKGEISLDTEYHKGARFTLTIPID